MLELKKVTKLYEKESVMALNEVDLKLPNKGLYFFVGKSGCGKSTLLNIIGGLDTVTIGDVIFNGVNLIDLTEQELNAYRSLAIGFVFQENNLLEDLNVEENIALSLKIQDKQASSQEIRELLERLDLEGLSKRDVKKLSGGQKQRVGIARAMIKKPQILLCDEPTGALDEETSENIVKILKELSKELLVIVVSHNKSLANQYGDGIFFMEAGKIVEQPEIVTEEEEEASVVLETKPHFPVKDALTYSTHILKKKKLRLSITLLLCAVACFLFSFILSFAMADPSSVLVREHLKNDVNMQIKLSTTNSIYDRLEELNLYAFKTGIANISSFKEEHIFESNELKTVFLDDSILKRLGYTLVGRLPVNGNEICVTEYIYHLYKRFGLAGSDLIQSKEELCGKEISIESNLSYGGEGKYVITGVVDTGFKAEEYIEKSIRETHAESSVFTANFHNAIFCAYGSILGFGYSHLLLFGKDSNENNLKIIYDIIDKEIGNSWRYNIVYSKGFDRVLTTIDSYKLINEYCKNYIIGGAILLAGFTILLIGMFIQNSISLKRHDIGILRALGCSFFDVCKIFIFETIVLIIPVFLIAGGCTMPLVSMINKNLGNYDDLRIEMISYGALQWFILFIFILVVFSAATFLPIHRFSKKKPVDCIRD